MTTFARVFDEKKRCARPEVLKRYFPTLGVTLICDRYPSAVDQAEASDAAIAAGRWRGPKYLLELKARTIWQLLRTEGGNYLWTTESEAVKAICSNDTRMDLVEELWEFACTPPPPPIVPVQTEEEKEASANASFPAEGSWTGTGRMVGGGT